ncbi:MAG: glycoside hydrolase family 5 protein [Acidimicrobiales bacterium]
MKFPRWRCQSVLSCLAGLCISAVTISVGASAAHAAPTGALPWLSVTPNPGQRSQITDPSGRTVILRGVNVVGLEDDVYLTGNGREPGAAPFWPVSSDAYNGACPQNSPMITEPPVCEVQAGKPEYQQSSAAGSNNDLAQMRSLGFNFIRLAVSWSQLEPNPGTYSTTYISRIAQVVGWAREQGIYVLLDMHEDNYSRFTPQTAPVSLPPLLTPTTPSGNHADGAPPWAVMGDGVPGRAVEGQGELNAYAETAFTNFWLNRVPTDPATGAPLPQGEAPGPGLQDHYIGAMAALATRFKANSTVAGYEIMNEPLPGLLAAPGVFDQGYLYPFYRRTIDALTGVRDGITCPTGISYSALCGYRDLGIHDTRH